MKTKTLLLGLALSGVILPVNGAAQGVQKINVCHVPPGNPANAQSLLLPEPAVQAHLAHGDSIGACGSTGNRRGDVGNRGGRDKGERANQPRMNDGGRQNDREIDGDDSRQGDGGRERSERGNQPRMNSRGGQNDRESGGDDSRPDGGRGRGQRGNQPQVEKGGGQNNQAKRPDNTREGNGSGGRGQRGNRPQSTSGRQDDPAQAKGNARTGNNGASGNPKPDNSGPAPKKKGGRD